MNDEKDLERLQSQVAKTKEMVRQTAVKVEELEASAEEIYHFKERLIVFPSHTEEKRPVRADKSKNAGDFFVT
ncbi:MAG TPA: hypothetical protein VGJ73_21135 [Verrucomicrobiae bacterium]